VTPFNGGGDHRQLKNDGIGLSLASCYLADSEPSGIFSKMNIFELSFELMGSVYVLYRGDAHKFWLLWVSMYCGGMDYRLLLWPKVIDNIVGLNSCCEELCMRAAA
jgi:hypothetical protein